MIARRSLGFWLGGLGLMTAEPDGVHAVVHPRGAGRRLEGVQWLLGAGATVKKPANFGHLLGPQWIVKPIAVPERARAPGTGRGGWAEPGRQQARCHRRDGQTPMHSGTLAPVGR